MKKQLLFFKIFLGVFVAILLLGVNAVFAAGVSISITTPTGGATTVNAGAPFTITATATTTNRIFFVIPAQISSMTIVDNTSSTTVGASTNSTVTSSITAPLVPGTYQYTITAADNTGATQSTTLTITVIAVGPVITSQPTNQAVCSGSYTTFSVTAAGTGLTYQWWVNGAPFAADHSDGNGTYTGSQTATLSISPGPGTYFDGSSIYCVVTNSKGSTNSNTVTLTRNTAPTITTQPASKTVCAGSPTSFSVVASGTGTLTYQWQANGVNLVNGTDGNGTYSGTQTATLNITPIGTGYNHRSMGGKTRLQAPAR